MKDRITMGFAADAAESAALMIADPRATERIIEACDYNPENELSAMKDINLNDELRRNAAYTEFDVHLATNAAM